MNNRIDQRRKMQGKAIVILLLITFTGSYHIARAQIQDGRLPASFQATAISSKSAAILPQLKLTALEPAKLRERDSREGVNNRYAEVETQEIDIREQGLQTRVDDYQVWRYTISCDSALSLGLQFRIFDIPQGASLYIYSPDKAQVKGGFTAENKPDGELFVVGDLDGNSLVIEYNEPVSAGFSGGVILGAVVKAYQSLATVARTRTQINCPAGADWQVQKKAVCLLSFTEGGSGYYCSGALINNTREDETPYFLTANHCISTSTVAATTIVYFNYEMSGCNTYDGRRNQSLSGTELKSTSSYTDFSLLLLKQVPPKDYTSYYAGWDNTGAIAENSTCIHHPNGSSKCIALDNDPAVSADYSISWDGANTTQPNTHWEVAYDVGTDEGGSSGSPLFDQNKRIIGQLHGGDDDTSLFGKLSLSWDYRSDASRQLKVWLDPDNTGITQLDGIEGYRNPLAAFSASETIACLSEPITLNDESRAAETWNWTILPATFQFVNGTSANSQFPQVLFEAEGVYSVSLLVSNENGSNELTQTNLIDVYAKLPVQWVNFSDEITLCGWELPDYRFEAEGAPYFSFNLTENSKFEQSADAGVLTLNLTKDALIEGSFDTWLKVTGTHGTCSASDSVLLHLVMPANDNVAQAQVLGLGYNGTFSNRCATVQESEPSPETSGCTVPNNWCPPTGSNILDNSIWFYFEGPSSGQVTVQATGIASQIAVYRAATVDYLLSGTNNTYTLVGAADYGTGSNGTATELPIDVVPGGKYWLQVDGTNGTEGDIELTLLSNSIEVYPNPSTGLYRLTVASKTDGQAELLVYNQMGQQVYACTASFDQQNNTIDFDLSHLAAGIYYFRAVIGQTELSKKLILLP
ncbi:MAG: T9SS type A sorting domain-containing protein [Mangrovibacterium sp.]